MGVAMIFDYDWWFGGAYQNRIAEAKRRCVRSHFPKLKNEDLERDKAAAAFLEKLEARSILYLRDGFSYELKELIISSTTSSLSFECAPADDAYKVGAFVVTLPFDEVVRVEVFAYHPDEKPEDMPSIKGFGGIQTGHSKRVDERSARSEQVD
ncbi:MAG: hypothetical protein DCC66_05470 [Planctomycetota bacterium]|nr:MAG: hypothetical protein DCC66_05470 [Planctomycetota bacterium]